MANNNDLIFMLRTALSCIKEFDGFNRSVFDFISDCDYALECIDPVIEKVFLKLLRSKLKGEALSSIQGESFTNYIDFKIHFLEIFRPVISIYQLISKVTSEVQSLDEKVIEFAIRIQNLGQQISYILLVEPHPVIGNTISVDEILLDSFLKGLKPGIELKMKKKFLTFKEAKMSAILIENNSSSRNMFNFCNSSLSNPLSCMTNSKNPCSVDIEIETVETNASPLPNLDHLNEDAPKADSSVLSFDSTLENNESVMQENLNPEKIDKLTDHNYEKLCFIPKADTLIQVSNYKYSKSSDKINVPFIDHKIYEDFESNCIKQNCLKHFSNAQLNPILNIMADGG